MKDKNSEEVQMTYDTLVEAAVTSGATSREVVSDLATLLKLRQIAHRKNIAKVLEWKDESAETWSRVETLLSSLKDRLHKLEQDTQSCIEKLEAPMSKKEEDK